MFMYQNQYLLWFLPDIYAFFGQNSYENREHVLLNIA